MAMIKTLTRQGNSSALIIDKAVMELMDIDHNTPLKIVVEGRRLIVEPINPQERSEKFKKALARTSTRNASLFRKLAK